MVLAREKMQFVKKNKVRVWVLKSRSMSVEQCWSYQKKNKKSEWKRFPVPTDLQSLLQSRSINTPPADERFFDYSTAENTNDNE